MADSRDVQLLLKATDLTSQTFQAVTAAVRALSATLVEQAAAAAKGDVSSKSLYATLRQLDEARRALASQNADIENFQNLAVKVDAAAVRAAEAKARFDALTATLANAGSATAKQEAQLTSLANKVAAADAAVLRQVLNLSQYASKLEVAGLSTRDLATAD